MCINKSSSIVANDNFITAKKEEEETGVGIVQSLKIYDEDWKSALLYLQQWIFVTNVVDTVKLLMKQKLYVRYVLNVMWVHVYICAHVSGGC